MNPRPIALLLALSPGLVLSAVAAPPLETLLPADAYAAVLVEDAPSLMSGWSASPWGRLWDEPEVQAFLAPLRERLGGSGWDELTREATGLSLPEIARGLAGPAALVLHDLEGTLSGGHPRFLLAAAVPGGGEVFRALLARELETRRAHAPEASAIVETAEEFRGVTMHVRRRAGDGNGPGEEIGAWTVVDGLGMVAHSADALREVVGSLQGEPTGPRLSESALFRRARARTPGSDVLLFLDPAPFAAALRDRLAAVPAPQPLDDSGFDPRALLRALDLEAIEGLYVSRRLGPNGGSLDLGLLAAADRGLLRLLAYRPGPVALPAFLPDDVLSASVARFSVPAAWEALQEILAAASPQAGQIPRLLLQQVSAGAGTDVEAALLRGLGDTVVSAEMRAEPAAGGHDPSAPTVNTLMGISLADRAAVEAALDGITDFLAGGMATVENLEMEGVRVRSLRLAAEAGGGGGPAPVLAFALTDDYLLLSSGSAAPLARALAARTRPGLSVWGRPDLAPALSALPPDAAGVFVSDVPEALHASLEGIARALRMTGAGDPLGGLVRPDAIPGAEVLRRHLGPAVGSVTRSAEGLFATVRFLPPDC